MSSPGGQMGLNEVRTDLMKKYVKEEARKPKIEPQVSEPATPPIPPGGQLPERIPGAPPVEFPETPEARPRQLGEVIPGEFLRETPEVGAEPRQEPAKEAAVIPDTQKFPVNVVPVQDIKVDPKTFQFKLETTEEGIQKPLQGEWNELAAGNFLLWESKAGDLYVANGHHRLELAKRLGQKTINAQILRESEGFSAMDARRLAAESNIIEGRGTIYDQAEYFRLNPEYTPEAAARKGLAGRGYAIGRFATDNTYSQFRVRRITPEAAEAIATAAPGNDTLQVAGVKYALDHPKADPVEVSNFVNALSVSTEMPVQEQGNLFGFNDRAIKEAELQAKAAAQKIFAIREQLNAARGAAKRPEIARQMGIDIKDPQAIKTKLAELNQQLAQWEKWYNFPELVQEIREETGTGKTRRTVQSEAIAAMALNPREVKSLGLSPEQAKALERMEKENPAEYQKLLRSYAETTKARWEEIRRGKREKMGELPLFGAEKAQPELPPKTPMAEPGKVGDGSVVEKKPEAPKVAEPEKPKTPTKEPWEMTIDEWIPEHNKRAMEFIKAREEYEADIEVFGKNSEEAKKSRIEMDNANSRMGWSGDARKAYLWFQNKRKLETSPKSTQGEEPAKSPMAEPGKVGPVERGKNRLGLIVEEINPADIEYAHELTHVPSTTTIKEYEGYRGKTANDPIIITEDNYVLDGAGRLANFRFKDKYKDLKIKAIKVPLEYWEIEEVSEGKGISRVAQEISKVVYEDLGYFERAKQIVKETDYFNDKIANELLGLKGPQVGPAEKPGKVGDGIEALKKLAAAYKESGYNFNDFMVGMKGFYRSEHPYLVGENIDVFRLKSDLEAKGYKSLSDLWEEVGKAPVEIPPKQVPGEPNWKIVESAGGFDIYNPAGEHWGRRPTREDAEKYLQAAKAKEAPQEPIKWTQVDKNIYRGWTGRRGLEPDFIIRKKDYTFEVLAYVDEVSLPKNIGFARTLEEAKKIAEPWEITQPGQTPTLPGFRGPALEETIQKPMLMAPEKGFKRREPEVGPIEGEITRRSDIVRLLSEKLDIPIRTGRFRDKAIGIFKVGPEVIRTRQANDIEVISHEVGHALQKFLYPAEIGPTGLTSVPFKGFEHELLPIATTPKAGQASAPEGFAEFIRLYITDPAKAQSVAPSFYQHFEHLMESRAPEAREIMLEARAQYDKWLKQPSLQRVLSQVSVGEHQSRPTTWTDFYTAAIDDLYPLKKAVEGITEGGKIPTAQNPYELARLLRGWQGKAEAFLKHSPFDFSTYADKGKSLKEILGPVKERLDEFRAYAVSRRALELEDRGIETGLLKDDTIKIVQEYGKDFSKVFDDLLEYQDLTLQYLRDSGILSKETYSVIKEMNKDYVPFYRIMETAKAGGAGKGLEAFMPIKRIKGSWRDIQDPLESIVKNTYLYIHLAEKNAIGKALVNLAETREGMGKYVEKLPEPLQKIKVNTVSEAIRAIQKDLEGMGSSDKAHEFAQMLADLMKHQKAVRKIERAEKSEKFMEEHGLEGLENMMEKEGLKPEDLWQLAKTFDIFRTSPFWPKENMISVWKDGDRTLYQVSPDISRTFQALDRESMSGLMRLLSVPASWLRAGATLTPEFIGRNPIRDQFSAFVYSKYGFIPGFDLARGVFHLAGKDQLYWDWKKGGGDHSMLVSLDRKYLQERLGEVIQGYPVWKLVKNPVEALRVISELGEAGTRLGEFTKGVKKEGQTKAGIQEAAMASREVTLDFARAGAQGRAVNAIIAFWNANVQGTDKMIRAFKENPVETTVKTMAAITLPSVLLAWANHDDPRYKEIPQWQKDLFWIVLTKDNIYRIPKPFELGIIFGSAPERMVDYIMTQDPEAFDELGKSLARGASPGMVPTYMVPFIENWANKSMFFDRAIVPRGRDELMPEYQYGPHTSEGAKILGHFLGRLPFGKMWEEQVVSPAKIENLVQGWTGGVGRYVMMLRYGKAASKVGISPEKIGILESSKGEEPTKTLADIPFIKAFAVRFPSGQAESIQKFYDNYDKASQVIKTATELIKREFNPDMAAKLLLENDLVKLDGHREAMSNIRNMIEATYYNPEMTGDEKREFIDIMYMQMIAISQNGNQIVKDVQKAAEEMKKKSEYTRKVRQEKQAPGQVPAFQ
jgi:hypothetical protein